jgi:hypothetical protein
MIGRMRLKTDIFLCMYIIELPYGVNLSKILVVVRDI